MRLRGVALGWIAVAVLVSPAVAAEELELYVEPKTDAARDIQDLFTLTLAIATFVFVFVEGLLFFTIWRWRKNKAPPVETGHRGHTTAEVVWTVIPAGILLVLGGISAQTLFELDTVPEDVTTTVEVEMFQWGFRFIYPDANGTLRPEGTSVSDWCKQAPNRCGINEMRIQEGERVKLLVTATDVIHALWIPEFGIKIDGTPGRVNAVWFEAPAPGEYFVQCAEYCLTGHHAMHGKVVVFAQGTQDLPYGKPAPAPAA